MPRVNAIVLVLPGGKVRNSRPLRPWHLAAVRMRPFTAALRAVPGLDVTQVSYSQRGWNGDGSTVRADALAILQQRLALYPGTPVVLVGHSMGGRVAAHCASHPAVRGVVALAPWWPQDEGALLGEGQRVHVLHGTADGWTDPAASRRETLRASTAGVEASWHPVEGAGHFMLRDASRWHDWTVERVQEIAALPR
ncbi:alpha/beta fold hydrolase [Hoyosella sp. G463]|uniref:Alpha/beta fold hydrolase n=1 Tax=Lolliginicoccus lacisalsi TaxID=2742202 RepID=A0A927JEN4_9ACTN|nr:alpha/beta fold hydrolase [Lolliginicoccus lacisalsi]